MSKSMLRNVVLEFVLEEEAVTTAEYAIMLALIMMACAASTSFLASETRNSFDRLGTAIDSARGN